MISTEAYYPLPYLGTQWQKACKESDKRAELKSYLTAPAFFLAHKHWSFHLGTSVEEDKRVILLSQAQHDALRKHLSALTETPLPALATTSSYKDVSPTTIPDEQAYTLLSKSLRKHNAHIRAESRRAHAEQLRISARSLRAGKAHLFLSIDIEAWEQDQTRILEVGWTLYDSRDGRLADEHRTILEFAHLRNGRYVADRKDQFLFGDSIQVPLRQACTELQTDLNTDIPLVLVGHDVKADIRYLKKMGVRVPGNVVTFDTAALYMSQEGVREHVGLGKMLDQLGIDAYCLHNAGNDAHYTMAAFLNLTD
ncbi:MAG: hypothetical protein DHS80DRAFT_31013 [Piptocephalis tieghemiana]|nr:MAG: hypothetical protein DHS80DRAFT_31013 [Piptocephalis tieghemiana]